MEPWPLRNLVLRTQRLELRPDDDYGLHQLIEVARAGIHPPEYMPFDIPWTDAPDAELGLNTLQFYWSHRAQLRLDNWHLHFLIRLDGKVIGEQAVHGRDFAVTREVSTGSWLGREFQGHGYGTEMRAAVLAFAFDHLGAVQARTSAYVDNEASLRVSRSLGYVDDGTMRDSRRGEPAVQLRMLVTADRFATFRPRWKLDVEGIDECLPLLIA
ncbi:GNAT family N-acetyltransferase [Kutzneria sp. CA-103260]|uniref:GNAT family N-acetyltransferase n=1 Tax=Kutzneria sp. CA-103260 TaxID=2802641 RepID=UPI001BA6F58A|nr:GNAT family N-acetyltransferase [Kutzneria sp. CA-103260]QUQ69826.1 N-acetyltransferase [Kutzneria sp. CA-103260]